MMDEPAAPKTPRRLQRIADRCERGQVLCRSHKPEQWWFEPSGLSCGAKSARAAVETGIVAPLSQGLFGDDDAQTYGVA